ncbi:hypothetical protein SEA_AIKOY__57 [Mycobacterium phage Aikoy]|uniref:DUF2786 domain-containing protein n=1 Tax=Mycobacterium phage Onyinye TaxID=2686235 RepID=A0A6B9L6Z3_9CAUD|nr:unknown function [Mycobacterium phage Onyinye]QHB37462.1 hypothetical protein SEA_ONYINYE_57 [Mycobacterium phage Onyinye]WKW85219.1 hypothetical protein SEA_AIKOY__57 [Mycobacterium phage Aikoy]
MADQKIMSRIMKLLERANHPETPEAEANSCSELAEKLMAQHMIDRMDLKPEDKSRVIQDKWEMRVGDAGSEFMYHVIDMLKNVVTHCGIRVHPNAPYLKREDGTVDYQTKVFTLVGFPEDMRFAELIWFRVFMGFVTNINPKWDASKPMEENVYALARAGRSWGDIHEAATKAGETLPDLLKGGGAKLRDMYKKACAAKGEEYYKTRTHDAYRATFVRSYDATIRSRLRLMREAANESVSDADKYALAIRDTKERVDEEFYRLFPEYDPEVIRRMREAEAFEAACRFAALSPEEQRRVVAEAEREQAESEKRWREREARASRARRNYHNVRERVTYDSSAWERGRSAANKVNLRNDGQVRDNKKGELG